MLNFTSCNHLYIFNLWLIANFDLQIKKYKSSVINATSFSLCLLRSVELLTLAAEI